MKYVLLLGRIFFSSIFIVKSFCHFSEKSIKHATSMGVPMAELLVPVSGLLILLGGLSILFGYKARLGAWLLVIFLVPTTLMMHKFWNTGEHYSVMMETYCFLKNISILGGALIIAYFGSGPMSLCQCKKG